MGGSEGDKWEGESSRSSVVTNLKRQLFLSLLPFQKKWPANLRESWSVHTCELTCTNTGHSCLFSGLLIRLTHNCDVVSGVPCLKPQALIRLGSLIC